MAWHEQLLPFGNFIYIYCGSTAALFNKVYCHSSWKFLSCGVSAVVVVYLYLSHSNLQNVMLLTLPPTGGSLIKLSFGKW